MQSFRTNNFKKRPAITNGRTGKGIGKYNIVKNKKIHSMCAPVY